MSFLIDTNVICEATRPTPSPAVLAWIGEQPEETLFLSAISLGEIRRGVLLMREGKRRRDLATWLHLEIEARFGERILAADRHVMKKWAQIQAETQQAGKPMPAIDAIIAATAAAHGLTLATRNARDFQQAGIALVNPWNFKG